MSESENSPSNFAYHVGRMLNKYQLLSLIDRGGMAEVYKSYQPDLDRDLAVKILYPHFTDLPGFVERFRREAQAAAALRHPNIVQIFDFDHTEDGLYYMILEYIDGQTLEVYLKNQAPLTIPQALVLFRQIASATQYAHERGLIHRDIKPANILLDKRGQAYLTDFGIAQIVGMSRLTQTDTTAGTPLYMAPEQIESQPITVAADVYSLGMLLYKMLTNHLPFESDNQAKMMVQKLTGPLIWPRQFMPELPLAVEEVIMTALALAPEDRFPDVVSLTWELEEACSHIIEADLGGSRPPPPVPLQLNRLDHYEIQEPITHSESDSCRHYVAHNQMLETMSLLEVLKDTADLDADLFWRRTTAVSEVDNSHVAPLTFMNQTTQGYWYVAMDYAPGTALAAVQLLLPTVDVATALNWTRQTAVGLQALHAANLMHGDLCLENLYLKEDGQIWLLGLSVPVADMTPQANIKNVGQILYSLLMGQVWTPDAPPLPNTIPNEVTALAERCLEASDVDLATITAVIAAIDEAIATKSVTVAAPVVETAVVPPPHRRSFVKPLVATVLAVILFAVTSFIFWPRQREESIPNALPSPRELGLTSTTRLSETATVAGLPTAAAVLATPTLAAPTAPISGSGPIHVALIEYNPDGDDALGEYIVVENRGETAVDLSNWRLEDSASRAHIFPFPNMMLAPGAQVKIWTGRGADTEDELYWGFGSAIWNNDGDTATLYDNTGTAVDSCSYPGGGIRAECP